VFHDPDYDPSKQANGLEQDTDPVASPHGLRTLMEPTRAWFEAFRTLAMMPALPLYHKGDGHPVLVLPGLATSDLSTLALRLFLRSRGYDARGWKLGFNRGPASVGMRGERIARRLHHIHAETGRKVSLVGWSLGGLIARELAKLHPEPVRSVVTLGSPIAGMPHVSKVTWLYRALSGHEPGASPQRAARFRRPPAGVPCTSIFSYTDGIVPWQNSIQACTALSENISVRSSHLGMGWNALVYYLLAERLQQEKHSWRRFEVKGWRTAVYRSQGRQ
jgi:pimeloyl-ACP methyl ester carboxylesterase